MLNRATLQSTLALTALLALAACGADSGNAGGEGQDCYPNNTCNDGLACQGGTCVASSGTNTTTGQGGHSSSSSSGGHGGTGGTGGTGGAGGTTSTGGTGGTTTSAPSGPPQIIVLGSNVTSITEGESVTFTAVVTDPNGIDDVIGGTLRDPGGAIYGAFATSSQEGAYQIVLSWSQIHQVLPIQFDEGASPERELVAEFFDQAAHTASKSISLTLSCEGHGACAGACKDMSADVKNCKSCGTTCATGGVCGATGCGCPSNGTVCNGVCKDLQTDEANCGTCGDPCAAGTLCMSGKCGALSACYPGQSGGGLTSCAQLCAQSGKVCQAACKGTASTLPVGGVEYNASTCTGNPSDQTCTSTFGKAYSAKCCCF